MANNNPTFGLPNPDAPDSVWYQFFTRVSQLSAESPVQTIALTPSPMSYTASTIGTLILTNATGVGILTFIRGSTNVDFTGLQMVPMAANDVVTITYSSGPTLTFIPSARA